MSNDQYFHMRDISPDDALLAYQQTMEYLQKYYNEEFHIDEVMPVLKEGYDVILNRLQFAGLFLCLQPAVPLNDKALLLAWITQAAFWMGYKEGKNTKEIELPKGFFDALGE